MAKNRWVITLAAVLGATVGFVGPALAECYDELGCTDHDSFAQHYDYLVSRRDGPTCDFLYVMRNQIYAAHGYCFSTPRGISEIGNQGCITHDMARVRLNQMERNNVATIQRAERERNCPA